MISCKKSLEFMTNWPKVGFIVVKALKTNGQGKPMEEIIKGKGDKYSLKMRDQAHEPRRGIQNGT